MSLDPAVVTVNTHNMPKPSVYECNICEKTMTCAVDLENHIVGKIHLATVNKLAPSGEKPKKQVNPIVSQKLVQARIFSPIQSASAESKGPTEPQVNRLFSCTLCAVNFTGEASQKEHQASKKHLSKVEAQAMSTASQRVFECRPCGLSMTGEADLRAHEVGKAHQKVVARALVGPILLASSKQPLVTSESNKEDKRELSCMLCGVNFSGEASKKEHLASKRHLAKIDAPAMPAEGQKVYECRPCGKLMTGEADLKAHEAGKAHKKVMTQNNQH